MDPVLFIALPFVVAVGSAALSWVIMQGRMDVMISRERESHAATRAKLQSLEENLPLRVQAVEETARRRALEDFLADFRVEERRYIRESRSPLASRHMIVLQERLFFRNIPLSNWVEHEMPMGQDGTIGTIDQRSVFQSARGRIAA